MGLNHGLEQIGPEFLRRSLAYGFQLRMPCSLVRNEASIILEIKMQVPYKIMFFEHFTSEFPDDCIITAHRDPHKCLAVGYGGIRTCQICKLPNRERTEPPSSLRHNAPVCGIRANCENVFLDGLRTNHNNGFAHLGLGRTPSVTATHMVQIHFGKRATLRSKSPPTVKESLYHSPRVDSAPYEPAM